MKKHNKFRSKHDKYSFKIYELSIKVKNNRFRSEKACLDVKKTNSKEN